MASGNGFVSIFQRLREEIELEFNQILALLSNKQSNLLSFIESQEQDYYNSKGQILEDIGRLNKLRLDTEELLSTNNLANTQNIILHQLDLRLNEIKGDTKEDPFLSLEWDRKGLSDLIDKIEIKIGVLHPETQELVVVSSQDNVLTPAHPDSMPSQLPDIPLSTQSDLEYDYEL